MKILHLADVHLDRPFVGLPADEARARRADLLGTFRRCLEAARGHGVDAVTIGGDLWEEEHVTVDTRRAVAYELGRLAVPVVLIAGNHDPLLPGGSHARTDWPANVRMLRADSPEEVELPGGRVSVWGVSWGAGPLDAGFLRRPPALDRARVNLLLLHGSAQSVTWFADGDAYCPFDPQAVIAAGFDRCLAGHIHRAGDDGVVVYPGSPEPLDWTETGRHAYAIVTVGPGGEVEVELHDVNARRYAALEVDCSGLGSGAEVAGRVEERIAAAGLGGPEICLSLKLTGAVASGCRVEARALGERLRGRLAALRVADATHEAVDVEAVARRRTVDGVFARRLLARIEAARAAGDEAAQTELELALKAGLAAMEGREVLVDVDP